MQAADFRGSRAANDSTHFYTLSTTLNASKHNFPLLPPGNLISGLPAALMSRAQVCLPLNEKYDKMQSQVDMSILDSDWLSLG